MGITFRVAFFIILASLTAAVVSYYIPLEVTVFNTIIAQEDGHVWRLATEGGEGDV